MIALAMLLLTCAPQEFTSSELSLPAGDTEVALRDMNGNGRLDLVTIENAGVRIRFLKEDGSYSESEDTDFSWPSRPLGWDLVDWDQDGVYELLCLDDEASVRVWRIGEAGHFEKRELILEETGSFLPPGIRRLRFVRDIDNNGTPDIVVPSGSNFRLFLQNEDGSFRPPHEVQFEADIQLQTGTIDELGSRVGQDVSIPWFRVEDIDGDGLVDLVSETTDLAAFFLASPELPSTPTWTLDVKALRETVPKKEGFDFDDLVSNLTPSVRWRIAELDGQAPAELFLQTGDTLRLYRSGSRLGLSETPAQVLRASGAILYFFIRDLNDDGFPELQIVRSETLSLGRMLRWLVLPGKLEFDLFTYSNQAGGYQRKPSMRTTLALEIPRLLSIEDRVEELEERFSARAEVPARTFDLDTDGIKNDVVDAEDGKIRFYRDRTPADFSEEIPGLAEGDFDRLLEHFILEDMDKLKDGETRKFGIDDLFGLNFSRSYELRVLCSNTEVDLELPLTIDVETPLLTPHDFNGDGQMDLIVWGEGEDETLQVQFLARK